MQQNLYYVVLNGATDMPLMQQTQQFHSSYLVAQSGAMEEHQMLHYGGPATRWVDFIRLHRRQLIYAARLRWPMPLIMSRALCVVLPHA